MSYGAKNYKNAAIKTAPPEQLLLMLYEAAIKSCKLAKMAIEKKNIPEKCKHITKVHDIVIELNNTLDHSKGPDVAAQLESLYTFASNQLLKANLNNDVEALDGVLKVLTTLYDGWVSAIDEIKKKGTVKL